MSTPLQNPNVLKRVDELDLGGLDSKLKSSLASCGFVFLGEVVCNPGVSLMEIPYFGYRELCQLQDLLAPLDLSLPDQFLTADAMDFSVREIREPWLKTFFLAGFAPGMSAEERMMRLSEMFSPDKKLLAQQMPIAPAITATWINDPTP